MDAIVEAGAKIDPAGYAASFRRDGYFVRDGVLCMEDVESLRCALAALPDREEVRRKRSVYGVRNLLQVSLAVRVLAGRSLVRQFVTPILGPDAFAVRAVFFDKVPDANWSLAWHQDKAIAVREPLEAAGYVGWSQKAGVWQAQPPAAVLAEMVAVRVHLDDCGPDNGPLRVLPGTHGQGWLGEEIDEWKSRVAEVVCTVGRGGIVAMCPLTLHASAASQTVGHRRVIHIEYAANELPGGLDWHDRVGADGVISSTPMRAAARPTAAECGTMDRWRFAHGRIER